jgi:hypothetical protein
MKSTFRTISIKANEKIPVVSGWGCGASPEHIDDLDKVARRTKGNYGVLCGPRSNIIVIDYDTDKVPNCPVTLETLKEVHGNTMIVQTPKGGFHVYHVYESRFDTWVGRCKIDGFVDIRTHGNYVVGPGSKVDGREYRIVNDAEPGTMPEEIFKKYDSEARVEKHSIENQAVDDEVLEKFGFTNIRWVSEYNFDCDQRGKKTTCPLCGLCHENNHFYIWGTDGVVFVKNHSNRCVRTKVSDETVYESTCIIEDEETIITDGENESSIKFLKLLKNDLRFCNKKFFIRKGGIWVSDQKVVNRTLLDRALACNFKTVSRIGDVEVKHAYSSHLPGAEKIVKSAMARLEETPDFIETVHRTTLGKLCWKNGYWDFTTATFHEGFEGCESTVKISRDFPKRVPEDIEALHERFLDPVFGHLKVPYLQYLAKCMAGYSSKMWGVLMGERDSGKSKLIKLLKTAFDGYCITVGADNLVYTRDHGGDPAKKLAWTVEMEFARMASTSEIRIDAARNEKIDGTLIKSVTGEDEIKVRTNYMDEWSMDLECGLSICCNDIGMVTPTDTYETMVPFNLPHKFVDVPDPKLPFMKKKDPSIKEFVARKNIGDALFWVLVDNFSTDPFVLSPAMKEFKSQFLEVDEFALVNEHFVVTGDDKDFVANEVIKKFLRDAQVNITGPKFKDYLTKRGARDFRTPVLEGNKRGLKYVRQIKDFERE